MEEFGIGLMNETSTSLTIQNLYISYMQENRAAISLFGKDNSIMSILQQHKTDAIFRVKTKIGMTIEMLSLQI